MLVRVIDFLSHLISFWSFGTAVIKSYGLAPVICGHVAAPSSGLAPVTRPKGRHEFV
jgi:hypothetical protein